MPAQQSAEHVFKTALENKVEAGIAAIQGFLKVLENGEATTVQGLLELLKEKRERFIKENDCSAIAVTSAGELFVRFITLAHAQLENEDFSACLRIMFKRGTEFLQKLQKADTEIARHFEPFVHDGASILVHGPSQAVITALTHAAKAKQFHVYLTRSSSECANQLSAANIHVTVIDDLAIGNVIQKMDCVLVGAEGVCESGGIVNLMGTYTTAIVAKQANKQIYTLVESYKFVRYYPLSQEDLPKEFKYYSSQSSKTDEWRCPRVDYTPPSFLSLLFTEMDILTPSAVSDRLINLYV